ncbi:MAG: SAM-dependent methyltransferase [Anaeromicrobium sp.]|uniref:class I SAM-dependent methyltransferase n=1 Tax=Anaeromicrobium sp. TaxID=1929132 RepID=UPI0025D45875|nr:rRNA adenine N-6-methyltransferase family protein [Anaeromicrobium sp.]MCT4595453.1 SAM-dependent methyltransferase [Anaeromicrobium sp.]
MKRLSFILQYILKPKTVGAILPSSTYLANRMMEGIDFHNARYIVEYGPGTGVFTDKLLKRRTKDTLIILLEYNHEFYLTLKEKYKNEENLYIINDSAENIDIHLKKHDIPYVDYVISGLPFASLPEKVSSEILAKTKLVLRKGGKFTTFQYTLFKKDFISMFFKNIHIERELINMPPAYVFICKH